MLTRWVRERPASSATRTSRASASRARKVWWRRARSTTRVWSPGPGQVKRDDARSDRAYLADERQRPFVRTAVLEAEEQDPLPLAEAQAAVLVRDLLGPRPEQEGEETRPFVGRQRHEPPEQALAIREETRPAFLHAPARRNT